MGKKRTAAAFPAARIKKMMQADEDVGKIATGAPHLVAKALEVVLEDLIRSAAAVAEERKARTISPQHMKHAIYAHEAFDFLHKIFEHVPVLEPESADQQPSAAQARNARTRASKPGLTAIVGSSGGEECVEAAPKRKRGVRTPRDPAESEAKQRRGGDPASSHRMSDQQLMDAASRAALLAQTGLPTGNRAIDGDDDSEYDE
mmetsp:Transcript_14006/g.37600  ORF Transcript_14006/g.37600 Transcript_14006/m.37600 type:complete len:203 (-) Transcript_14006:202-810(-)